VKGGGKIPEVNEGKASHESREQEKDAGSGQELSSSLGIARGGGPGFREPGGRGN